MNTVEAETQDIVALALAEDIGPGDITSEAIVPAEASACARLVQKQAGVIFGLDAVAETLRQCGDADFERLAPESEWRDQVPADLALVTGSARSLLAAERTALNLLGHLSGIATLTALYVAAVAGTRAQVLDTRKTTPGMRLLEKAAVVAGGAVNHRIGLFDAILIKENHVAMAGGIATAVELCRRSSPGVAVEVECRDLEELAQGIDSGADRLMLDNLDAETMIRAVAMRDAAGSGATLEASGGISLETIRPIAESGVDFISAGAVTHSAPALDISMLIEVA